LLNAQLTVLTHGSLVSWGTLALAVRYAHTAILASRFALRCRPVISCNKLTR